MSLPIKIQLVKYGSPTYDEIVSLRYEILRKPLGMVFTAEQLAAEADYFHFAVTIDDKVIACCMLVPEGKKMKMKQVAVATEWQGKGVGAQMVLAVEAFSKENGFTLMYCHARDTAIPFYEKLGYHKVGDMFTEVSIPHFQMEKTL